MKLKTLRILLPSHCAYTECGYGKANGDANSCAVYISALRDDYDHRRGPVWRCHVYNVLGERFLAPVHKGMTMKEVQNLVGAPKKIISRTNETTVWSYSPWWDDAVVYFDTNSLVSAIETD